MATSASLPALSILALLSSCSEKVSQPSKEILNFTVEGQKYRVPKDCVPRRWGGHIGTDGDGDPVYDSNRFQFVMPDYKCLPFNSKQDVRANVSALEYHLGNRITSRQVLEAFRKLRLAGNGHLVKSRSFDGQGKLTLLAVKPGAGNLRMVKLTIESLHNNAFLACEFPRGQCEILHALPKKVLKIGFSNRYKARAIEIDERVTERVESFTR